jgi:hypothetical protein
MTTPQQQPSQATPALVLEHAAELLVAEEAAAHLVTAALRLRLAGITRLFQRRWTDLAPTGTASGISVVRLMADLARELLALPPIPADRLQAAAEDAYRIGVRQAYREAGLHPQPIDLPSSGDIASIDQAAADVTDAGERAARIAQATSRGTPATVGRIVAVAQQGANSVERAARTIVNEQANTAIRDVAERTGAQLLWVAERDACLTCLALSGHIVDAGAEFDVAATFAARPIEWTPFGGLTRPPRHPRCRCRTTPWLDGEPTPNSLPMVLRREAERTVLHGWGVASESDPVHQRAASRLLQRIASHHGTSPSGWKVPASVRTSTATRLRKGTFGVTPFPTHRP